MLSASSAYCACALLVLAPLATLHQLGEGEECRILDPLRAQDKDGVKKNREAGNYQWSCIGNSRYGVTNVDRIYLYFAFCRVTTP